MFNFITTNVIAIVAIVVAGIALLNANDAERNSLGVTRDTTEFTNPLVVDQFTQGGGCEALTDANGGTYTLTQAQMLESNCFRFVAGGAGQAVVALTLPATSTMKQLLPNVGDYREWVYDASALSAATTTTITAGTGIDLIAYTVNDDVIDGGEYAQITCWRKANTNVACVTTELLNAD